MEIVAGDIEAVGFGLIVTVLDADAVHEPPSVTVTEYVVLETGVTVMLCVNAPVLQEKFVPPEAVSVMLDPLQTDAVGGEMDALNVVVTVTVAEAEAVHPLEAVAVTLYVVVEVGLTVMLALVVPLLHK
jgi:hypothetical protein